MSNLVTNLSDTHQDGHRAGVMTKTETDNGDSNSVTNLGNTHQDGHRAGFKTKAETDNGDSKALTKHGNFHQDGHRASILSKAETDSGDSEEEPWLDLYLDQRGSTQDGLHGQDIIDSLTRYPKEVIVKGKGPGDYGARHDEPSERHNEEEK